MSSTGARCPHGAHPRGVASQGIPCPDTLFFGEGPAGPAWTTCRRGVMAKPIGGVAARPGGETRPDARRVRRGVGSRVARLRGFAVRLYIQSDTSQNGLACVEAAVRGVAAGSQGKRRHRPNSNTMSSRRPAPDGLAHASRVEAFSHRLDSGRSGPCSKSVRQLESASSSAASGRPLPRRLDAVRL